MNPAYIGRLPTFDTYCMLYASWDTYRSLREWQVFINTPPSWWERRRAQCVSRLQRRLGARNEVDVWGLV